jgi:hypothetical protein
MPVGNPEDGDGLVMRLADCTSSLQPPWTEQVSAGWHDVTSEDVSYPSPFSYVLVSDITYFL